MSSWESWFNSGQTFPRTDPLYRASRSRCTNALSKLNWDHPCSRIGNQCFILLAWWTSPLINPNNARSSTHHVSQIGAFPILSLNSRWALHFQNMTLTPHPPTDHSKTAMSNAHLLDKQRSLRFYGVLSKRKQKIVTSKISNPCF